MSNQQTREIKQWMKQYADKTAPEIRAAMAEWQSHAPGYIAGELVLQQQAEANDPARPLLTKLNEHVATIDGRLASVERVATRSEFRSWSFWLSILALIVGVIALVRDYLNLQRPDSGPSRVEPATQSTKTSHSDPAALPAAEPPEPLPASADTKATAPTSEPNSK